jgi:hypothetical protein
VRDRLADGQTDRRAAGRKHGNQALNTQPERRARAHQEVTNGVVANGTGAQHADGLARHLEAYQPRQRVVAGPHAVIGEVEVPAKMSNTTTHTTDGRIDSLLLPVRTRPCVRQRRQPVWGQGRRDGQNPSDGRPKIPAASGCRMLCPHVSV